MIRLLIASFIWLSLQSLAFANNGSQPQPSTAELNAQLLAITAAQKGRFRQENHLQGLPFPIKSSGRYEFKNGKLFWQNLKPVKSLLVLSRDKLEQSVNGKVSLSISADQQPILSSINKLFMAIFDKNWPEISDSFDIQQQSQEPHWEIKLIPKQGNLKSAIKKATLKGDSQLRSFRFTKSNDDETHIWFLDNSE